MSNTWLQRAGDLLARRLDALNDHVRQLGEDLKSAAIRARRFIWEQIKLLAISLRHLLSIFSTFLALIWIGSGFLELTFRESILVKSLGWIGALIIGGTLCSAIWVLFRNSSSSEERSPRVSSARFLLIHVVAIVVICVATLYGYEFRFPVLRLTQSAVRVVLWEITFQGTRIMSLFRPAETPANPDSIPPTPAIPTRPAIAIPMHNKSSVDDGQAWVTTPDDEPSESRELNYWIEQVWLSDQATVLDVAVRTWDKWNNVRLHKAEDAYLTDDRGTRYDLRNDGGVYNSSNVYICKQDEIVRFKIEFPRLDHRSKYLLLHQSHFQILRIDLDWSNIDPRVLP